MQRSFSEELKYKWQYGGMHIKLIFINVAIFLLINILLSIGSLLVSPGSENLFENILNSVFSLKGTLKGVLTHPWGLVTSIFAHFSFWHILFNMVFFYFIAQFFLRYFSNQRMLYTYVLGGIAGGLLQVLAFSTFPKYQGAENLVVGASGAVNAVFMAAAFYRPMAEVRLFGAIRARMMYIALAFILLDILRMGGENNVAHFAHLGGAIFGYLSIKNADSNKNIINWAQRVVENIIASFKGKPKLKVKKGGANQQTAKNKNDDEYNRLRKIKQDKIDAILDKISKSGYDSLTKEEKAILFEQSQR